MLGEFVESQIHEGLQTSYFQSTDWCWREGMSEWQGVGTLFQQPAPPPRQMPAAVNPYAAPRALGPAKRMPTATILQPASNGSRLAAVVLDQVAFLACCTPAAMMSDSKTPTEGDWFFIWVILGGFAFLTLTNLILMATSAQTVGKKLMGIRIANMRDGSNAGFFKIILLRNVVAQGLLYLVPLYGIVDVCFIFSEDQQCLHDKIAGTQVLKAV